MTLDEKIKIKDKLRSGMTAAAVGLTSHWLHFKANFRWHITLMPNNLTILYYITQSFHKKYRCSIFIIFIYFLFPRGLPVSPLVTHNINFVQRGFNEHAACEARICRVRRRFTIIRFNTRITPLLWIKVRTSPLDTSYFRLVIVQSSIRMLLRTQTDSTTLKR
jgi:hypothetical protein